MAYRAPELFDVKTGVTLDEKVDIWVRPTLLWALGFDVHTLLSVTRLYVIRACLPPLSVRESPNNATGRFDSHGRHERSVQASAELVFPGLQKFDRYHVKSEPCGQAQHPSTHRDDGTCPAVAIVIRGRKVVSGWETFLSRRGAVWVEARVFILTFNYMVFPFPLSENEGTRDR